jgi:ABC-type nickel/cobalt efflux system permease component RcnA
MSVFKLFSLNITDIIFVVLFLVLLFTFLKDFKMTSKRSWITLLSLTALGVLAIFQTWRRKKFLEQFREREKALEDLEKEYDKLKDQAKISEEAYLQAKADLERAKVEAGIAIMKANEELAEKIRQIESDYHNMTVEESIAKIKEALQPS